MNIFVSTLNFEEYVWNVDMILAPCLETFSFFHFSAFLRIFYRSNAGQGGPIWKIPPLVNLYLIGAWYITSTAIFNSLTENIQKSLKNWKMRTIFMGHPVG